MDTRKFLESISFFSETLSSPELDVLADYARRVEFDPGSALIREGDLSDSMFVIVSGNVTVSVHDMENSRAVATLGPGQLAGEMALMTGAPRTATVAAETPVVALEIERPAVESLLSANPTLWIGLAAMLAKRQQELDALYGPELPSLFGPLRANFAKLIQAHFPKSTHRDV